MAESVDVVVVGMGPGGEAVAGDLAEAGLRVVGVESRLVGGECPYYGCIPSKMMVRAADALAEARRVPGLAGQAMVSPEFTPVALRIRDEATTNWDDQVAVDRFTGKGGTFVRGHGRLIGPDTVAVGDREFTARRAIVLNPGTEPAVPPIPGLADTPYWTNRELLRSGTAPESLVVIGGGAVGLELAQSLARFGTRVTIVEAADRLAAAEEPEAGELLARVLRGEGIEVWTGAEVRGVRHEAAFSVDTGDATAYGHRLLVATGRRANLGDLGLQHIGIDPQAGRLDPDERMRVAERVYAVGDVTGHGAFTHMSMYQAAIATRDILGEAGPVADYRAVPRVTFTDPEIGSVGMTRAQAVDAGLRVRAGFTELPSSARGWIHHVGNDGFVKLIEDADRGVLVGGTTTGPSGGEMLSALTVAVHGAVPTETLRGMIYAYPTFHRAIEVALDSLG